MRVGLFGGSFNPIHNGHLNIIKNILERDVVDEIWVIPCAEHAFNKDLIDAEHRVKMIGLAISDLGEL